MKGKLFVTALLLLAALSLASADQAIESAQQKLKDDGFYYGEINGKKDADTSAALRRYQIRNGLQISGELDGETQRSLGVTSTAPSVPSVRPPATPFPNTSDLRAESPAPQNERTPRPSPPEFNDGADERADVRGPHGPRPKPSGLFDGTPYEVAPPEVQRRVIVDAQTTLARGGYYRGEIDGVFGPNMEFSLRAYQSRFGLTLTGHLDLETLAALDLLPRPRTPEFGPPQRRISPPRWRIGPGGERVYIPN
jgi:peptidoglycan hydrolase-like protein with peptidoglycan-binding domain